MTEKTEDMNSFLIKKEKDFYNRYYKKIYNGRIEKSTDKKYALEQYEEDLRFRTECSLTNENFKEFITYFEKYERLGHSMDSALRLMSKENSTEREDRMIEELLKSDQTLEGEQRLAIEAEMEARMLLRSEEELGPPKEWNKHFSKYPSKELIATYALWKAHRRFLRFLQTELIPLQANDVKITETILEHTSEETISKIVEQEPIEIINRENTARRQTLAIYYLNLHLKINKSGKDISLIRFIQFLTDKNQDNIKDALRIPLKFSEEKKVKAVEELLKDLKYIRLRFEDLKLAAIVEHIDADIETVSINGQ